MVTYTRSRSQTLASFSPVTGNIHKISYDGISGNPTRIISETDTTTYGSSGNSVSKTMSDCVIPSFHKLRNLGFIFMNPMTSTLVSEVLPGMKPFDRAIINSDSTGWIGAVYSGTRSPTDFMPDYLPHSFDSPSTVDIAVTSAFAASSQTEAQLYATAGEFRETLESVASLCREGISLCIAFRRLQLQKALKILTSKDLKSRWLEWRYAIRPLMFEIDGLLKALDKIAQNGTHRQTFRGYAETSDTVSDEYNRIIDSTFQVHIIRNTTISFCVRAGLLTDLTESAVRTFGLSAPIEGIWELIPFSFIVDWFFNIGKWISSLMPHFGVRKLASWYVLEKTTTQTVDMPYCFNTGTWSVRNYATHSGSKYKITIQKTRVPVESTPVFPSLTVRLDSFKILDLIAIFKQLR